MITLVIVATFIIHFYYDWNQGPVAEYKCRDWWVKNGLTDKMYKSDYKCALFAHSFLWALLIMIPSLLYWYHIGIAEDGIALCAFALIFVNTEIHYIIDYMKANSHDINLWQDQIIHFIQIVVLLLLSVGYVSNVPN